MPETYPPLSAFDLQQFSRLTAQEGYTIEGQIKRLKMIRPMIEERLEELKKARRRELAAQGLEEQAIEAAIKSEFQTLQYETVEINQQPYALVVEKSSLPPDEPADYTIMMPQHVDTISPNWPSFKAESLKASEPESNRISNLGVFDMGQAVANAIAIIAKVRVPEGMRLYAAFTRGEETPQSVGANALIGHWSGMANVDLVLSSEIGPLTEEARPKQGDRAMRYIVARPGRVRVFANVSLLDEARGHASIPGLPNAKEERDRLAVMLKDIFNGSESYGFEYGKGEGGGANASLKQSHPLLGDENLDMGVEWYPDVVLPSPEMQGRDTDYMHPHNVHCKFYARIVPPNSREKVIQDLKTIHKHIAERRKWTERGIKSKLEQFHGEESYSPFAMPGPEKNEAVRVMHEMLTKIAGAEAVPVSGTSVADENLYAMSLAANLAKERAEKRERSPERVHQEGGHEANFEGSRRAVLSVAPDGGQAHSPYEWVNVDDMARVRHALMRLIQDEDGYAQLAKKGPTRR